MKKKSKNYLILGLMIILYSCSPMTKESYLEDYKDFISEVSNENSTYTESDWQNSDKRYNKFTGEWYEKFEDEFLWQEQIILSKYKIQYNLYKYKGDAKIIANEIFSNYDELKSKIKYYAENNMSDDIDYLIEQANEIGGATVDMLDDILVELDVEYNAGYSVKLKLNNNKNAE